MRTSAIAACSPGSSTSTTPPCCAPLLSQPKPRSPISSSQLARGGAGSRPVVLGELDQQQRIGLAAHEGLHRRAEHGDVARELDHGAVDQLDRDRPELDDMLRGLHRLVEAAEMADADARAFRQRRQLQLDAGWRSASVPSEPTRRCARLRALRARRKRVEIVAADAALHLREARLRSRRPRARRARAGRRASGRSGELAGMSERSRRDRAEMRLRAVGQHGVDRRARCRA